VFGVPIGAWPTPTHTLDFTVQADGTKAVVSVIDEGCGIPDKL
jgi:C4-dicarboxylate-specific signal transduction histidine kinase